MLQSKLRRGFHLKNILMISFFVVYIQNQIATATESNKVISQDMNNGPTSTTRRKMFINNVLYYKNDPYRNCPQPYVLIGMQCLFFSQPYDPWGMSTTWEESYANYYDAVTICRSKTKQDLEDQKNQNKGFASFESNYNNRNNVKGEGDLASEVVNYEEALKYCNDRIRNPGGCSPSLLHKKGKCRQWSPIDGKTQDIPCDWRTKMRFVCEYKRQK